MKTIKITKWEELNIRNEEYHAYYTRGTFYVEIMDGREIAFFNIRPTKMSNDSVIAWLALFGFSVEFIEPQKLSKADWHMARALLEMYPKGYVARGDKPDKELVFYEDIPTKGRVDWIYESGSFWHLAIGLFPFIAFADEHPYSTKELAELKCEEEV